ncbi:MAG: hypothetical protein V4726_20165 [Verrucomicrobiota bacterium]
MDFGAIIRADRSGESGDTPEGGGPAGEIAAFFSDCIPAWPDVEDSVWGAGIVAGAGADAGAFTTPGAADAAA